jgi:hypothetical protein
MFSVQQKREISDAVQKILRSTMHPELPPTGEVSFSLNVAGAESWSYATIVNNGAVGDPGVNPHNELMASMPAEEARSLLDTAKTVSEAQAPYTPDPRVHPDDLMQEMLKQQLSTLTQRIFKAEEIIIDYNKRLGQLKERDDINRKLYSELRFGLDKLQEYLLPIMEDNLIAHHDDQIRNMMTAMKQLGNPQVQKSLEGK